MSAARGEAAAYYRRGLAPIPTKPGTKEPDLLELAPYLERRATGEELQAWPWRGVGIVTGPVSDILVLDVDGHEGHAELNQLAAETGVGFSSDLLAKSEIWQACDRYIELGVNLANAGNERFDPELEEEQRRAEKRRATFTVYAGGLSA